MFPRIFFSIIPSNYEPSSSEDHQYRSTVSDTPVDTSLHAANQMHNVDRDSARREQV